MPLGDTLNETFNLDYVDGPNEERSSEESPVRDQHLRMFLDSFNETTVLFNDTMTGDVNLNEKNEAVGDWVFKNSKFLHEVVKNFSVKRVNSNVNCRSRLTQKSLSNLLRIMLSKSLDSQRYRVNILFLSFLDFRRNVEESRKYLQSKQRFPCK